MSKRGIVFLLGLIVVIVLSILAAVYFKRSITESHSVTRDTVSSQAFWNAEDGLSQAIAALPSDNDINVGIPGAPFEVIVDNIPDADPNGDTYRIVSTGRVLLGAAPITRTIEAFIQYVPFQATANFDNAIEVNNGLKIVGSVSILPDATYAQDFAGISFAEKFKISSSDMKNLAKAQGHYYEDPVVIDPDAEALPGGPLPDFMGPDVDPPDDIPDGQVTWIKITDPNKALQVPKTGWSGKGILIVEGDAKIEGSKEASPPDVQDPGGFYGIIWVTGELQISGDAYISGTVISETSAEVTSVTGNPTLEWNLDSINSAKHLLEDPFAKRARLSWREL